MHITTSFTLWRCRSALPLAVDEVVLEPGRRGSDCETILPV